MTSPDLRALLFGEDKPKAAVKDLFGSDSDNDEEEDTLFSPKTDHTFKSLAKPIIKIAPTLFSEPTLKKELNLDILSITEDPLEKPYTFIDYNDDAPLVHDPLLCPDQEQILLEQERQREQAEKAKRKQEESKQAEKETQKRAESLFDVFIVAGLSPDDESEPTAAPSVLFEYPTQSKLPIKKIVEFCFPGGIKRHTVKNESASISEIHFGQKHLHDAASSFVFVLTGNESRTLYGICVAKDELVRDLPLFIHPTTSTTSSKSATIHIQRDNVRNGSQNSGENSSPSLSSSQKGIGSPSSSTNGYLLAAPRIYCLLSEYPLFHMHYDLLYAVIAHERLLRINVEYQKELNSEPETHRLEILDILQRYHSASVPAPGQTFLLPMPYDHKHISFVCPRGYLTATMLTNWCVVSLMRTLSLPTILTIFSGVLLENSIVFVSKNLGLLSNVILSIIPMIRPLEWQGLLVPILPDTVRETLNAPVPYICGVVDLTTFEIKQRKENNTIIVHLDANALCVPKDFPELPEYKKLEHDLNKDHASIHGTSDAVDNPYYTNYEYSNISQRIITSFNRYCCWFVRNICKSFKNTDKNDFTLRDRLKNEFLRKIASHHQPFVKEFINTQSFNNYLDNFIQGKTKHN